MKSLSIATAVAPAYYMATPSAILKMGENGWKLSMRTGSCMGFCGSGITLEMLSVKAPILTIERQACGSGGIRRESFRRNAFTRVESSSELKNTGGVDFSDATDVNEDPDHDGMTNLQEYIAGTDPQDGQSYLKLNIRSGGSAELDFQAISNRTYIIEYSGSIPYTNWTSLTPIPSTETNRSVTIEDSTGSTNRFYRLRIP